MNREEYLKKLENIKKTSSSPEEASNAHEWLLCDYVKSLEDQLNAYTRPIGLVDMNIGNLVLVNDHGRLTLHYVTFYGKDEVLSKFWKYDGNVTKLDGNYAYFKEDGTLLGDPNNTRVFPVRVFHTYDLRFKCISDK